MSKLLLQSKCEKLIKYSDIYVMSSFPKDKMALKIRYENQLLELLENIVRANFNKGNIRAKYITDCLVNISLIDSYIGVIYDYKIIIKKRFLTVVNMLSELNKMVHAWRSSGDG